MSTWDDFKVVMVRETGRTPDLSNPEDAARFYGYQLGASKAEAADSSARLTDDTGAGTVYTAPPSAPVGVEEVVDVDIPEPEGLEKVVRDAVAAWEECRSPMEAQAAMYKISNDLRTNEAGRALAQHPEAVDGFKPQEGEPPTWFEEWFIAKLDTGERVVLRRLPEEWTYDYTTADQTYYKARRLKWWMQFPDSAFVPLESKAQQPAAVDVVCAWAVDEDSEAWDGACGAKWQFTDGGPVENDMRHCPQCGKRVSAKPGGAA